MIVYGGGKEYYNSLIKYLRRDLKFINFFEIMKTTDVWINELKEMQYD